MGSCSGMLAIYIIVRLSALLVSTKRGSSRALTREASDRELAPRFFCICTFLLNLLSVHRGSQVTSKKCYCIMENLNGYVAPLVKVIEVEVEKGFATSGGGDGAEWD